jgi:large subunit ribosomal protein L29
MKASEIKELSIADLVEKIDDMEEQQGKLLLTHAVSPLENPLQLRENRRIIARLKTALNQRENGGKEVAVAATAKVEKKEKKAEKKEEAKPEVENSAE